MKLASIHLDPDDGLVNLCSHDLQLDEQQEQKNYESLKALTSTGEWSTEVSKRNIEIFINAINNSCRWCRPYRIERCIEEIFCKIRSSVDALLPPLFLVISSSKVKFDEGYPLFKIFKHCAFRAEKMVQAKALIRHLAPQAINPTLQIDLTRRITLSRPLNGLEKFFEGIINNLSATAKTMALATTEPSAVLKYYNLISNGAQVITGNDLLSVAIKTVGTVMFLILQQGVKTYIKQMPIELTGLQNFTAESFTCPLEPLIGRQDIVENIFACWERQEHPVLIGEPGVGKTAIIMELGRQLACLQKGKTDASQGAKLKMYGGSATLFITLNQNLTGNDNKLKEVVDKIKEHGSTVVLFLDAIHVLWSTPDIAARIGTFIYSISDSSIGNSKLLIIGATTKEEYLKYMASHPAAARRFKPIEVLPLKVDVSMQIIRDLANKIDPTIELSDEAVTHLVTHIPTPAEARHLLNKGLQDIQKERKIPRVKSALDEAQTKHTTMQASLPSVMLSKSKSEIDAYSEAMAKKENEIRSLRLQYGQSLQRRIKLNEAADKRLDVKNKLMHLAAAFNWLDFTIQCIDSSNKEPKDLSSAMQIFADAILKIQEAFNSANENERVFNKILAPLSVVVKLNCESFPFTLLWSENRIFTAKEKHYKVRIRECMLNLSDSYSRTLENTAWSELKFLAQTIQEFVLKYFIYTFDYQKELVIKNFNEAVTTIQREERLVEFKVDMDEEYMRAVVRIAVENKKALAARALQS